MSLPELNDTEGWAALVKSRELPRSKPSDYVRCFIAMRENGRRLEELLLANKIKTLIEAISRKHIKTHEEKGFMPAQKIKDKKSAKLVDWNEDVVKSVANELLFALMRPGSSGRRGLEICFGLTVRRKTDTVLKKSAYRQHNFFVTDDAVLNEQVDTDAATNMEIQVIAQSARAKLVGRRASGFDTATGAPAAADADPANVTRRERAAKSAVKELLDVAAKMRTKESPAGANSRPNDFLSSLEKLKLPGPPDASEFYLPPGSTKWFHISKQFARAYLLEDEKDELPLDWRERAYAILHSSQRWMAEYAAAEPEIIEPYYPDDHMLDAEEKAYWLCLTGT